MDIAVDYIAGGLIAVNYCFIWYNVAMRSFLVLERYAISLLLRQTQRTISLNSMDGECRTVGVAGATLTLPLPYQLFVRLSLLASPTVHQKHGKPCSRHTNFGHNAPPMLNRKIMDTTYLIEACHLVLPVLQKMS